MKTQSVLGKLVGKTKYLLTILYALLVVLNQKYQLGLGEAELDRIMWVILAGLGLDAAEGGLANFKKLTSPSQPPAPPAPPTTTPPTGS